MTSSCSPESEKEIRIHSHDPLNQLKPDSSSCPSSLQGTRSSSSEWRQNLSNIVCGGLAGILAKTAVAPVERLKIMFQEIRGFQIALFTTLDPVKFFQSKMLATRKS